MDMFLFCSVVFAVLFDVTSGLNCIQCYSFRTINVTNVQPAVLSILPNMVNVQCQRQIQPTVTANPNNFNGMNNNQDLPPIPTLCPNAEVVGTNTEIRCGYYTGHIVVKSTDPSYGSFTMSVLSMTCFSVERGLDYGCHSVDYPLPIDLQHFNRILFTRLSNLVTMDRYIGSVCYCRSPDCSDINSAPSSKFSFLLFIPTAIVALKKYLL